MVLKLVKEIDKCLDVECYLVALMSTLSLPDICGKAEFPMDTPSVRYKKWYDLCVGNCEIDEESKQQGVPYMDGELLYSLRNSLLHEGNVDVNEKTCNMQTFEVVVHGRDKSHRVFESSSWMNATWNGGVSVPTNRAYCINLFSLCERICEAAENYYKCNREKFSFLNGKLLFEV